MKPYCQICGEFIKKITAKYCGKHVTQGQIINLKGINKISPIEYKSQQSGAWDEDCQGWVL